MKITFQIPVAKLVSYSRFHTPEENSSKQYFGRFIFESVLTSFEVQKGIKPKKVVINNYNFDADSHLEQNALYKIEGVVKKSKREHPCYKDNDGNVFVEWQTNFEAISFILLKEKAQSGLKKFAAPKKAAPKVPAPKVPAPKVAEPKKDLDDQLEEAIYDEEFGYHAV